MKSPLLLALASASLLSASPPRFEITGHTIAGGGNALTDGNARYALTGTTGQAEAASALNSAGGRFALAPGFWHVSTVVAGPDAPPLRFLPAPSADGTVVLAWPVETTGWILEMSTDLRTNSWVPVNVPSADSATDHTVTVHSSAPRRYFRLRCP